MKLQFTSLLIAAFASAADMLPVIEVEGQPLAANARRVVQALDFLGVPLADEVRSKLQAAVTARDAHRCAGGAGPDGAVRGGHQS